MRTLAAAGNHLAAAGVSFSTAHAAYPSSLVSAQKSRHVRELLNQLHFGRAGLSLGIASIQLPMRGAKPKAVPSCSLPATTILPTGDRLQSTSTMSTSRINSRLLKSIVKKEQVNGVLGFNSLSFLVTVRPNPKNSLDPRAALSSSQLSSLVHLPHHAISASQNRHPFVLPQKFLR